MSFSHKHLSILSFDFKVGIYIVPILMFNVKYIQIYYSNLAFYTVHHLSKISEVQNIDLDFKGFQWQSWSQLPATFIHRCVYWGVFVSVNVALV